MTSTPEERKPTIRDVASGIAASLREAGYVAYFAGGCVRDRLLGREPSDYDVVTDARPEQVRAVFRRSQNVGEAFGVVLVRRGGFVIEVATFRTDGVYTDGRRPDAVEFSDAEHDAARRDFTINGLFEDPATGEVIDHVGGRADLEAGVIRAIGDPAARLREDRLRMLRAIRFAARLEFTIDPGTADTIRAGADHLRGVSRERIGHEVRAMMADPNRVVAAWEMQYLGLDASVLDEPGRLAAPLRLGGLGEDAAFGTTLAAWLLDRHGSPPPDEDEIVRRWAAALVLSGDEERDLREVLSVYATLRGPWENLGIAAQKRLAASPWFAQGQRLIQSENQARFVEVCRRVEHLAASGLVPTPLLTGDDLIAAGLEPGPVFRRVLDAVYDAQLEGAIERREQALTLAAAIHAELERASAGNGESGPGA